jgi:hypothetical protein
MTGRDLSGSMCRAEESEGSLRNSKKTWAGPHYFGIAPKYHRRPHPFGIAPKYHRRPHPFGKTARRRRTYAALRQI